RRDAAVRRQRGRMRRLQHVVDGGGDVGAEVDGGSLRVGAGLDRPALDAALRVELRGEEREDHQEQGSSAAHASLPMPKHLRESANGANDGVSRQGRGGVKRRQCLLLRERYASASSAFLTFLAATSRLE